MYDTAGNITTLTTSGDYDLDGSTLTTTTETRTEYDSASNAIRVEVENGAQDLITTMEFDERGLLTTSVGPNGNASGVNPAGFAVTATYDVIGRPTKWVGPAVPVEYATNTTNIEASWSTPTTASTTETGYDTYGNATHSVDALEQITVTDYDLNARPVTITHPNYTHPTNGTITPTEIWEYDQNGNVTGYTTRLGNHTSYEFDDANRVVKQTDPQIPDPTNATVLLPVGETTTFYDYAGRTIKMVSPDGAVTEQTFDELSRVENSIVTVRAVDGQPAQLATTSFEYSWLGYITKVTDPTNVGSTYVYDSFGALTSAQVASFTPATSVYDGAGRLVRTTTPDGVYTTTTYDQAGRALAMVETGSDNIDYRTTSTTYDASGAVLTQISGRGGVTTYEYNNIGLLTDVNLQVDDTDFIDYSYGYDAAGNTTRVTDGDGHVTRYVFNEWGLMTHTLEPNSGATAEPESERLFVVGYNPAGQSNYELSPGGRTLTRSYNELALPILETSAQTGLTTVASSWAYDRSSRPVQVSHPTTPTLFTYDDRGLLVTQSGGAGAASFAYDEAGRTLTRDDDAGKNIFAYDPDSGLVESVTNGTTAPGGGGGGGASGLDVLLLVNNPTSLNNTEDRIKTHLTDDGHTVTLRDAGDSEETSPGDLIIVAHDGGLSNKYKTQAVPIISLAPGNWDNMELIDLIVGGTVNALDAALWTSQMSIKDATHDLAGGLSAGTFSFLTSSKGMRYVKDVHLPSLSPALVVETTTPGQYTLLGYTTGQTMANATTAPERRVLLSGLHNGNATPHADGWTLFDAAVDWATSNTGGTGGGGTSAWDIAYQYDTDGRLQTESYADGGTRSYTYDAMGRKESDIVTNDSGAPTASTEFTYSCDHEMISKDVDLPAGANLNTYTYDHAGRLTSWDAAATVLPDACPTSTGGASGALDVLFLVSDPASLNNTEDRINTHLSIDHTVTLRDAGASEETSPGDLIIIGHTGGIGSKYASQTTPILELQPSLWKGHDLIDAAVGVPQWASSMVITDASHELAGGLSGTQGFLTTSKGMLYTSSGDLHADADVVAETNVAGRVTLFGYEAGDNLAGGGTAPGHRVGLSGLHHNDATPTTAGWIMFDAAVDWATDNTGGGGAPTGGLWTESGETYTYDNRGNRLTAGADSFTYDFRNRLKTDPDGAYTWNDDGTLDVFTPTSGPAENYTFDAATRLTQVSDGTDTTTYGYDALDRISIRNSAAFTYAGGELDPTSDGTDLFHRTSGGELLAYETPAATTFAYSPSHHDLNGLIGSDGNLTDSQTYDPYGDPLADTGSTAPVLGYQSDYTDPVTEHVWMGARWYQPSSATFLSRDTVFGELRTPFSLNRFTYGVNNPIKYWDPDGRACIDEDDIGCFLDGTPNAPKRGAASGGSVPVAVQGAERIDSFGGELPDRVPAQVPSTDSSSDETLEAYLANINELLRTEAAILDFVAAGSTSELIVDPMQRAIAEFMKYGGPDQGGDSFMTNTGVGIFRYVIFDDTQCFGDDTSVGWCFVEGVGIVPWGKIGKIGNGLYNVTVALKYSDEAASGARHSDEVADFAHWGGEISDALRMADQPLLEPLITSNRRIGNAASDAIAAGIPGSVREVTMHADSGLRYIDVLTPAGLAIESKVGRTSLRARELQELTRDIELLKLGEDVTSVQWEFFISPVTGLGGPTKPLREALEKGGVTIVIH